MFAINLNHLLAAKDISNAVFSFYQDSLELWAILVVRQTHKNSPRFSSESQIGASQLLVLRHLIGQWLEAWYSHWLIPLHLLSQITKSKLYAFQIGMFSSHSVSGLINFVLNTTPNKVILTDITHARFLLPCFEQEVGLVLQTIPR